MGLKIKIGDILLICFLVSLSAFLLLKKSSQKNLQVVIYKDGKILASSPLSHDKIFTFDARYGKYVVEIKKGKVYVRETHCPLKICKKMSPISKPGEVIVCIPNRIIIKIEGKAKVDAITY